MDFQYLVLLLAALACPLGMGAMMWWMQRGMSHPPAGEPPPSPQLEASDGLVARNQALEARVAELERTLSARPQIDH
ncbi:MAG TPA: hypothetical protein VGD99_17335 [Anaerolineae bacterium]